jgi:hypothetical protein
MAVVSEEAKNLEEQVEGIVEKALFKYLIEWAQEVDGNGKINKYTTIIPSGMTSCSMSAHHIIESLKMAPDAMVIK